MSLLSELVSAHGLSTEAIVATSNTLETRSVEARALGVKRSDARRKKAQEGYDKLGIAKPKGLSRGVSAGLLARALEGKSVSRLVRRKILTAVNDRLVHQKKEALTIRQVFGDVKVARPKVEKKKK